MEKESPITNQNTTSIISTSSHREITKPKKKIKNEYYEMKPSLIKKFNLRFIEPYEFKYQLYAKGRWIGRKIIDVLVNEFRNYDKEYFIKSLKGGNIRVNDKIVEADYILSRNDFLTHVTTRKENPIIDQKLEIVYEDKDFLVVDKPSSWPVHVCGGYQFNTLHRILMDEYGYTDLKVLHRLDKHTSGTVIMAKTKNAADSFRKKLHTDKVQKFYLARVKGDFPHEKVNVQRSIIFVNKAKGIYTDVDDEKAKEYYTTDIDDKYDKSGCRIKNAESDGEDENRNDNDEKNEPKSAETDFEKLFYDEKSNSSVVIAKPRTGRTHQIRIHLRYLGYPIANDPCYGGIVFNDLKELNDPDMLKYQHYLPEAKEDDIIVGSSNSNQTELNPETQLSVSQIYCYKIWLHAWTYKFDKYEFKTTYPSWATKEYEINKIF
jgi:23S rRNA-/tRNA-specific pseudouridylate synthase